MDELRTPGDAGHAAAAPKSPRRRTVALALAAAAFVAVVATVAASAGGGTPAGSGNLSGGGASHAVSVIARPAATVELLAAPGQVTIDGSAAGAVTLTGELHWSGHAPIATTRLNRIAGVLLLSYRCAAASPCTGNYRLVVPWRTAVVLRQPSGHVIISHLDGPLRITARSADISATGLRSESLRAAITSGHMSATFVTAPRHVALTLISAQATLRLPASAHYAISEQVTAGYVHAGIPQAARAAHTIAVRIDSGELELLSR
jgi:hypothetical protein